MKLSLDDTKNNIVRLGHPKGTWKELLQAALHREVQSPLQPALPKELLATYYLSLISPPTYLLETTSSQKISSQKIPKIND